MFILAEPLLAHLSWWSWTDLRAISNPSIKKKKDRRHCSRWPCRDLRHHIASSRLNSELISGCVLINTCQWRMGATIDKWAVCTFTFRDNRKKKLVEDYSWDSVTIYTYDSVGRQPIDLDNFDFRHDTSEGHILSCLVSIYS